MRFVNPAGGGGQVPEPTSMAIFGLGALGFAYRARRKSKA
ncbi:MAG: PEP-CTERM sorting domain-containing protein [Planctomycetaceae bacterium]|nr:PEP-CTERM sorting domain-containing protein [Planctomycetaceae bacterium]